MQLIVEIQLVVKLPHELPSHDRPPPIVLNKNARSEYITTENAQR